MTQPIEQAPWYQQDICITDLNVIRGEMVIKSGISFCLSCGQILYITGDNGAGKTTLLMQLADILPIEYGQATWGQLPVNQWSILYYGHQTGIHSNLTVVDNLQFLLALQGISPSTQELAAALAWVGLTGYQEEVGQRLSAGQQRRVSLARLYLSEDVPLWILDEPLTALDVGMIERLTQLIQRYASNGGRVMLTSHHPLNLHTDILNLNNDKYRHLSEAIEYEQP